MWHFAITYNIAHFLSLDPHFQKVRSEFVRVCDGYGVRGAEGLDWKGILDALYSDF
jgi:hypothetical protein